MADSAHELQRTSKKAEADELAIAVGLIKEVLDGRIELDSEVHRDVHLTDLGFKSIEFIKLVLSLEQAAGCSIDGVTAVDSLQPFQTVGDVADLLRALKFPTSGS